MCSGKAVRKKLSACVMGTAVSMCDGNSCQEKLSAHMMGKAASGRQRLTMSDVNLTRVMGCAGVGLGQELDTQVLWGGSKQHT